MQTYMGIDGGGSNLRVVIVDETMQELAFARADTANPNIIGYDKASTLIQELMRRALSEAQLDTVNAVGIGIAGAPVSRSREWLTNTIQAVLADTHIVPSSDSEIALVGTFGERRGILILSGTGSIAFGINAAGESLEIGGWGYLMGDKGSGYWLGSRALKLLIKHEDEALTEYSLIVEKLKQLPDFTDRATLISWLYEDKDSSVARVARLAQIVLEAADMGDAQAATIIKSGAAYLVHLVSVLKKRLNMPNARIAFAGSLLTHDTLLSREVMAALLMNTRPTPVYEGVVGAALLAKLDLEQHLHSR